MLAYGKTEDNYIGFCLLLSTFHMLKHYIIKEKNYKCLVDYAKCFAIMILVV